jgi:hypothetical protein
LEFQHIDPSQANTCLTPVFSLHRLGLSPYHRLVSQSTNAALPGPAASEFFNRKNRPGLNARAAMAMTHH